MSRRFRMSTALDVDDVLLECVPYAIRLANEKYHFDPPITIHEVTHWGKLDSRADVIFEFLEDPEFFRNQPVIAGAKEFVHKLCQLTEVFICTAIDPRFMGIRAQSIMEHFPEIPKENIIMGSRKDMVNVDILLDDGMHNIFTSNAAYPILLRRPWNQNATGMLAVNNYDEFLKLIDVIRKSYSEQYDKSKEADIVVLVGPSGSGKSKLAKLLLDKDKNLVKLKSYTTADQTAVHKNDWYNYVTIEEFNKMADDGIFFESTMYAGHGYGSVKKDVDDILASGKKVVATMDICGAMTLKVNFPNVQTIYIKKDRKELLSSILKKRCSDEDKVNRLISIEDEKQNENICDFVVNVTNKDYEKSANEILNIIHNNE